ncbi:sigma-54-dependent transcriptional regulator [Vulgatibacter sp.]|uniref:sigma-54-dependent transcriptional regulator n=1 Tax=Vulgatibacter sp. TaxID=1971226 RepID=UPI00356A62C7
MAFHHLLVVDDEESMRHVLLLLLEQRGYAVRAVGSAEEALQELESRPYDVVITDVRMPRMSGIELVQRGRAASPETSFLVMSAYGSEELAIEALKAGAFDYVSKPFKPDELAIKLRMAEERERFRSQVQRLKAELHEEKGLDAIIGHSVATNDLARQIRRIAPVKTTVLITGESGTGKELVARALHELSPRSNQPFVGVNCGAIPETLMESELFGHVKGAFTDAGRNRKGLFAEADGGTLFLDEIAELSPQMQVKLLRVLQEEEIRPVGESRSQKIDVRVVAATMKDLQRAVADGSFREDLYYRLNVVNLDLPPLRARTDDIPPLVRHFLGKYNARLRREPPVRRISDEAMALLRSYPWPGNVRELENAIERALVLAEGEELGPEAFDRLRSAEARSSLAKGGRAVLLDDSELSIKQAVRRIEEELIRRALEHTGGNRTRAAQVLEISHRALLYKLKEFRIR